MISLWEYTYISDLISSWSKSLTTKHPCYMEASYSSHSAPPPPSLTSNFIQPILFNPSTVFISFTDYGTRIISPYSSPLISSCIEPEENGSSPCKMPQRFVNFITTLIFCCLCPFCRGRTLQYYQF